MHKLVFQVEFKSDIVLPSTSNTEGNILQLDFIPGSNFLGMAAKKYSSFSNPFEIFHSGKVQFGDATLLIDDKEAYKMPFSIFYPKTDETKIYHHHFLEDSKKKELGQLKQMRKGYILPDMSNGLKLKYVEYNYSQKSAYDKSTRRSKTSSMYGYKAIKAGVKWQFTVKYDDSISSDDIKLLKDTLLNSKRLGKSKSSQYGEIEITQKGSVEDISSDIKPNEEIYLYAKSRIALSDHEGNATYDLIYLADGLSDKNIVYKKCQIRTSSFTPYNRAMQTKTYERATIDKGSVIVLRDLNDTQIEELINGVGIYLAEGFGELLINPSFLLQKEEIKLHKKEKTAKKDQRKKIDKKSNDATVQFLINRHNKEIKKLSLANDVMEFIDKKSSIYEKISKSQWGTIRSICTSDDTKFKEDIKTYISNGKVPWRKDQIDTLLDDCHSLEFIKLLSIQMPKHIKGAKS